MSQMEDRIKQGLAAENYRPVVAAALAKELKIGKKALPAFREALERLIAGGAVREGKKGRLRLKPSAGFISGVVKKIASGAGFVIPLERTPELQGSDIFIAARDLRDAQTGDEVLVRLTSTRRSGGQRCGQIEKVMERASSIFVGTYFEQDEQGFVTVDGTVFSEPIHVGDPGAKGAQANDKVVIEMLRFPTANRTGEAVLTKVLGQRGDPGIDTMTVIHILGLPYEFSDAVLEDARQQADQFAQATLGDRMDLTHHTIITIDPADARDFDDAISLTKSDDGHWHLGVHIADVAHFVTPGSPLDREARLRGTSVYLPRHVIPMLPEVISNGLASLQQDQLRLTKTAWIEFDAAGNVLGTDVANTAIKVVRRFAYEEVMPIIQNPRQTFPKVTAPVRHLLENMYELAMMLRKRRFANGALQMGIPEVAIDFDKTGNVTGAHLRPHDASHEIIEEFMLAANVAVARLLASKNLPFLRRAHGEPDELKLRSFQEFCRGLGYEIQQSQSRTEIQAVITSASGQPEERAINFALLRSMKQAVYTPEETGHYALAEQDYCHFTSPIRRYPDLTIHRLIGELAARRRPQPEDLVNLIEQGKHCSATERRAEKAERELIRIKLLRYMAPRVGEEMEAIITGVENFGLFCQGVAVPAEGLIHMSALADDFYEFNQTTRTLTGQRHKREFRLGDPIRVIIASVDVERRQLDLRIADVKSTDGAKPAPRTTRPERPPRRTRSARPDEVPVPSRPSDSRSGRGSRRNPEANSSETESQPDGHKQRPATDRELSALKQQRRKKHKSSAHGTSWPENTGRTRGKGESGDGRKAKGKKGKRRK